MSLRVLLSLGLAALASACAGPGRPSYREPVRIASFNAYLNRPAQGDLLHDLETPDHPQIRAVAEVLQRVRPDVVLLCEFDYDAEGRALELFRENYLGVGQNGARPIEYPYVFLAPSNTGEPSGRDLDGDGTVSSTVGSRTYGNDCFGYGAFPGQYAMALLSKFPIDEAGARTFQTFRWRDLPGALLPDDPSTAEMGDWYSQGAREVLRLSSKSHWDVPIQIGNRLIHALCAHPTPPGFDGEEDRNGRRNHDEIRLWAEYLNGAPWLVDDAGQAGGLEKGEAFVLLGDYNADPRDGDSVPGAIAQLLEHPRVRDVEPRSKGGRAAAQRQGGVNAEHRGDPALDTGDFSDVSERYPAAGNLRIDYALASRNLRVLDSAVFWPAPGEPEADLIEDPQRPGEIVSSDHRLVWIDVRVR